MKKYSCKDCNYSTDRQIDMNRHNLSKKHIENSKILPKNIECAQNVIQLSSNCHPNVIQMSSSIPVKQFACTTCDKSFAYRQGLFKHKKQCENIKNDINTELLIQNMQMKLDMVELKNKYMQEKLDLMNSFKNIAENTAETSKTSCSALNYIIKNYNNAPCIQKFTKFELLTEGNEDYSIAEIAIHKYNYNELCTYIGDIIIAKYKTDDPKKQTMWTSDVNRLAYMIREVTANNKAEWFADKGGVRMSKYVVQPILNHINDDLDRYYNEKLLELDDIDTLESNKTIIRNNLISVKNIMKLIKTNQLNDEIVKYMAKFLYLDRKPHVNVIRYDENITIEELD